MPDLASDVVCQRAGVRMCTGITPANWPAGPALPGVNVTVLFFLNLHFYTATCDHYKDAVPVSGIGIGGKRERAEW